MPAQGVQDGNAIGFGCPPAVVAGKASTTRKQTKQNLQELFSSTLLVSDKELGSVVGEIDRIRKALKSDAGLEARRVALHPAVWSAVKHAILDRELRQLALTDELTCLYNSRGLFAATAHQLKLAQRNCIAAVVRRGSLETDQRLVRIPGGRSSTYPCRKRARRNISGVGYCCSASWG